MLDGMPDHRKTRQLEKNPYPVLFTHLKQTLRSTAICRYDLYTVGLLTHVCSKMNYRINTDLNHARQITNRIRGKIATNIPIHRLVGMRKLTSPQTYYMMSLIL